MNNDLRGLRNDRPRITIDIEKDETIHFMETDEGYLLTLSSDGCIYSKGRLIIDDAELVAGLRELEKMLKQN